jgi:hypothetical protein
MRVSIDGVVRELLVRCLESWTPAALHARRATVACAATGEGEAVARALAEFGDRLRGRRLALVLLSPERLEPRLIDGLQVYTVSGATETYLPAALTAAGAAGAPVFAFVAGAPEQGVLRAVASGKPSELMFTAPAGEWESRRDALRYNGFPLTAGVELVDADGSARLVGFGTGHLKRLEAFKAELWAVDGYAGVRYRDPGDPDGHLLDITLRPHPGPLRRELLAYLRTAEWRTVAELKQFALTETVYRAEDCAAALSTMVSGGAVERSPAQGRLAGDVLIRAA